MCDCETCDIHEMRHALTSLALPQAACLCLPRPPPRRPSPPSRPKRKRTKSSSEWIDAIQQRKEGKKEAREEAVGSVGSARGVGGGLEARVIFQILNGITQHCATQRAIRSPSSSSSSHCSHKRQTGWLLHHHQDTSQVFLYCTTCRCGGEQAAPHFTSPSSFFLV